MVAPIRWRGPAEQVAPSQVVCDSVPERVAKQAIAEVLSPLVRGMELVKPWLWAHPLSDEHRALVWIEAYKGGSFELEYGICCTWVPHRDGTTWRWHRTLKQARRDLWVDHFTIDAPASRPISRLHGLDNIRRQAEVARDAVGPLAASWWGSVDSPHGVLVEANRQEGQRGVTHWPSPELVTAFTLAKLGDLDAARDRLSVLSLRDEADRHSAMQLLSTLA